MNTNNIQNQNKSLSGTEDKQRDLNKNPSGQPQQNKQEGYSTQESRDENKGAIQSPSRSDK